mmetsp:Transcript_8904/g.28631  ORF Transcript_8904/g.28631 Transcript_8904/m.28631 type:complete len:225 (+) Transcript_8904:366-1040(+)
MTPRSALARLRGRSPAARGRSGWTSSSGRCVPLRLPPSPSGTRCSGRGSCTSTSQRRSARRGSHTVFARATLASSRGCTARSPSCSSPSCTPWTPRWTRRRRRSGSGPSWSRLTGGSRHGGASRTCGCIGCSGQSNGAKASPRCASISRTRTGCLCRSILLETTQGASACPGRRSPRCMSQWRACLAMGASMSRTWPPAAAPRVAPRSCIAFWSRAAVGCAWSA